ncbi:MAG: hypothetical protein LQ352_008410, partial [Teloschistes flavicans]
MAVMVKACEDRVKEEARAQYELVEVEEEEQDATDGAKLAEELGWGPGAILGG